MRFVVDETSWNFDGLEPTHCVEALEQMLDRIDDAQMQGNNCCYSDDLFRIPLREGRSFYELYQDGSPILIPDNVRERIAAAFARLPAWQDWDAPWPESLDAIVAGGFPEFAPSIAWAHRQTICSKARSAACISHPIRRMNGKAEVIVAGLAAPVWFVSAARDSENFFRWLIIEATVSPDEMAVLAPFAFQGLDFVEGSFNGIKSMSKPYRALVPTIVKHLGALSDEGVRIFSGSWARIPAEFGPHGIDISDENGETKQNRTARIERTRTVNGEARIFWWHTKLERHEDRIHICPAKINTNGRMLIGIFCRHLTT